MPTIYQDRCAISLYDAQHATGTKTPIAPPVIDQVVAILLRFKRTCQDFQVLDSNITLVATEATRNAINRDSFLLQIEKKTEWTVKLLTKEEEGRFGAMGIASSVGQLEGICMDMGGGSVQMTWVITKSNGDVEMSPVGSASFPYGAAALMSDLSEISVQEKGSLEADISFKLQAGLADIQIPSSLKETAHRNAGYSLYLSGGGFRGRGYVLMSRDVVQPYPIPIINGYTVPSSFFFQSYLEEASPSVSSSAFRISSRRASQFPAVQLVIEALARAQILIAKVVFTQGGVREGLLYAGLAPSIRAQSPLVASTVCHAPRSAGPLTSLFQNAVPNIIHDDLLTATINLLYFHAPLPKDIRAAAALRSTTTGVLAGAHGLSHRDRGMLALILCERWGADLSNADNVLYENLQRQLGPLSWWSKYVGRVAEGLANIFPAGVLRENEQTIAVEAGIETLNSEQGELGPQTQRCWLRLTILKEDMESMVRDLGNKVRKVGKPKNWGKHGWGVHVDVQVRRRA